MSGQTSAGASVPSLLLSTEKVAASHRSRDAYVYVRQSTPSQMIHHTESLAAVKPASLTQLIFRPAAQVDATAA